MGAKLLEGRPIALKIKEALKKEIELLKQNYKKTPYFVCIHVGENPASEAYCKAQIKAAEELGILYDLRRLPKETSQEVLIKYIEDLNKDNSVSGIIIQMPLPPQIDGKMISRFIKPEKDIEGLHPENIGNLIFGKKGVVPCTPAAAMELLESTGIDLYGKEAVVVGHSEIVGKPLVLLLLNRFVTTTVCHIATGERGALPEHVARAEVLIVAVGKPNLIKGEWVREDAIVIDIGINRVGDKIVGDVEFDKAAERAGWITPVPGGVGPLTVAMLMRNVVEAFKMQMTSESKQ